MARVPKAMLDDGVVKTAVAARRKLEAPLPADRRDQVRRAPRHAPRPEHRGARARGAREPRAAGRGRTGARRAGERRARRGAEPLPRGARRARAGPPRRRSGSTRSGQEQIASEKEWLQARAEHEAAGIRVRAAQEKLVRLGLSSGGGGRARGARGGPRAGEGSCSGRPRAASCSRCTRSRASWSGPIEPMVTVGDLSDLWLWADVYEDQLGRVTAGARGALRAGVSVKAFPGEVFPGTVELRRPHDGREDPHREGPDRGEEPGRKAQGGHVRGGPALPARRGGGARGASLGGAVRRGPLVRVRPPPRRVLHPPPGRGRTRRRSTGSR